jgi:hypothetical protein
MSWLQEAMESGYEPTLAEIEQDLDMEAELNLLIAEDGEPDVCLDGDLYSA